MQAKIIGVMGAAAVVLAGCNTVSRGTQEVVTITASPPTASIRTSLGHTCPSSPCVVTVERRTEFTAYAEAQGHQPGSVLVRSQLSDKAAPGVLGNAILPGGSVGLVLDAANGAMMDHVPNPAHIDLAPTVRMKARRMSRR